MSKNKKSIKPSSVVQREGVVYMYTLTAEGTDKGKIYVGETSDEETRRSKWRQVSNTGYGGVKISEARKKYGVKEWDYKVLEKVSVNGTLKDLKEVLRVKQKEFIIKYDTVKNGFNTSYGEGMAGIKHSAESRAKISAHHRHYNSPETIAKIRAKLKDRKISEETKKKISKGNKGKKRSEEVKKAQSERMKGKEPIAASLGLKRYIQEHGHGPTKGKPFTDKARANMKAAQQRRGTDCIAIFPDGHEKFYSTMSDAAKDNSLDVGSVSHSIKNNGTTKGGLKFRAA